MMPGIARGIGFLCAASAPARCPRRRARMCGVPVAYLKRLIAKPVVKYGLLTAGSGVWVVGLVSQLSSADATLKYLVVSLAMVAVAFL
jgi:hypothetical protein